MLVGRPDAEALRPLFEQALALPVEQRSAFLDNACGGDATLRAELSALLAHPEEALTRFSSLRTTEWPRAATNSAPADPTLSHYRILEKLGGGGMGVVYKALDTKLRRTVALKFLPPHLSADDSARERFAHEAEAASALDHANICTIFDIDKTTDGQLFISMAYYPGETLKDKISRGPLAVSHAVDYAFQIASGLAKAHEQGIVHRDVKPANVIITDDGTVKILDFGLAKAKDVRLTTTGITMGTAAYMSPEQMRGEEVDHRTDVWSLGVVLYEALTGERPFKGDHEQAIVQSILTIRPKPLSAFRGDVPVSLERLVERALAKRPAARYQQMPDLVTDLRAIKEGSQSVLPRPASTDSKPVPSIAVLPFVDMSPQRDQEYFCDGMAEELIDALAKQKGLRVVSRTSAFQFKGRAYDIRDVGQQLGVSHVLEGSVRKAGNYLRITAQLIDVDDGYHLWSEKYDRDLADVFAIQDEIARAIVETLKGRLVGEQESPIVKRQTPNLEAYTLYLKGRYFWNKRYEVGLQQAMGFFRQAIENDPAYALAYAGLADCFILLGAYEYLAPKEAFPYARGLAQKALEIDGTLAEAHASLGFVAKVHARNYVEAEQKFRRSIELNPNYAVARWWYSLLLAVTGRIEEALAELKRAEEADPLLLLTNSTLGWILYLARRYDEAIDVCLDILRIDPNIGTARATLGLAYIAKSDFDRAISELQQAKTRMGPQIVGSYLARAYALSGRKDEATRVLDELQELSKKQYMPPYFLAAIYVALDRHDEAFRWLDKAYEERDPWLVYINIDPMFDSVRSDSRLSTVIEKMGLGSTTGASHQ
jgi:serine/threonine protein kinase/tetratricopeptide (TPR) repeat protein